MVQNATGTVGNSKAFNCAFFAACAAFVGRVGCAGCVSLCPCTCVLGVEGDGEVEGEEEGGRWEGEERGDEGVVVSVCPCKSGSVCFADPNSSNNAVFNSTFHSVSPFKR